VVRVPGYSSRDPRFDSRHYQIFWEVVGLERGLLNLARITEELLEWKSRGSGSRKPRLTAVRICCADHKTPSVCRKLALTLLTSRGRSVNIVCLRTKATEFVFIAVRTPRAPNPCCIYLYWVCCAQAQMLNTLPV
jgi:hypothetical protein